MAKQIADDARHRAQKWTFWKLSALRRVELRSKASVPAPATAVHATALMLSLSDAICILWQSFVHNSKGTTRQFRNADFAIRIASAACRA
jgi:hypothetical protein